jgi:ubiquinone/menaquinone biosynthesis C-methylase UbiE
MAIPLKYLFALIALPYLLYQMRRPTRWTGQLFLRGMNRSHSALTDWGLSHGCIRKDSVILDVGCGGGATIRKLARIAENGTVNGIDYSSGSVAASRGFNADFINAGRVHIQKASVSHLPFSEATFDLATAIETQYYWPDLVGDMREIRRVLKPGGRLIIVAETYKGGRTDKLQRPVMKLLRAAHLDVAAHRDLFVSAGYDDVEIFEEQSKGWICATGTKPL